MTVDAVRQFYQALNRADFDALADRMSDDVRLEFPGERFGGTFQGRRRVLVFLRQNQRLFDGGLKFDVKWAAVAGDRAVAQWSNSGIARNGERYRNSGVTIFRFVDEIIVSIQDYLDTEKLSATWPRQG